MAMVRYGAIEKISDVIRKDTCQEVTCPKCNASLGKLIKSSKSDEEFSAILTCKSCGKEFKFKSR